MFRNVSLSLQRFPCMWYEITEDWGLAEHKEQLIEQKGLSPACTWENHWQIPPPPTPSCLWWLQEEVPWDRAGDGDGWAVMLRRSW